ncbi:hypothetical protein ACWGRV_27045 [Streptomyces sp. NPDC055663]
MTDPICSEEAARAAGLDIAPTATELTVIAESIVDCWGDRFAEPDDLVASTADAGAQLARAVPLILAELARLRAEVTKLVAARSRLEEHMRAGQHWRNGRLVSESLLGQPEIRHLTGIPLTAAPADEAATT